MLKDLTTGAGCFLRGFGLMLRPGVKRHVIGPILINLALFGLVIGFGARWLRGFVDWLSTQGWGWLGGPLWVLFVVAALAVVYFGFALAGGLLASPFLGYLSAAVERSLTGAAPPASGISLGREILRTLVNETRKLIYVAILAVPCLLLFLIPVINLVAPFIWAAFWAWVMVLQSADYPLSNHGLPPSRQRRLLGSRRALSLGFGAATSAAMMVPGLNLLVIPAAVAGATWMVREHLGLGPAATRPNTDSTDLRVDSTD